MKRSDFIYKTIQLILYIILTLCCLAAILLDKRIYHLIASDPGVRMLCILLWLALGLSFVFLYRDFHYFSSSARNYRELDHAIHSDPLSGLANRLSCDVMIRKYRDQPLPQDLGCIMLDLTNIRQINAHYGHQQGDRLIRDFSNILHLASAGLCFAGHNSGSRFLVLFEEGSSCKIETLLHKLEQKILSYNEQASDGLLIEYRYGVAFHEGEPVRSITDLIALADRRIHQPVHHSSEGEDTP